MRNFLTAGALALIGCLLPFIACASEPAFEIAVLDASASDLHVQDVVSGSLDGQFTTLVPDRTRSSATFWLRLRPEADYIIEGVPALSVHKSRSLGVELFARGPHGVIPLATAAAIPGFRAVHETVFVLPGPLTAGEPLYLRVQKDSVFDHLRFSAGPLHEALDRASAHALMISVAVGALLTLSATALLIWFVLSDRLLLLYATLFTLQALYVGFVSGHAFEWPLLEYALPLGGYTWNVAAALAAAAATLFAREIAELRSFSPRVYVAFGWLARAFVVLAFANVLTLVGLGDFVAAIGNLVFVGGGIFVLVTAFLAWRRDNRAAGWFLLAWGLLEMLTIVTAIRLLIADPEKSEGLLYYGLPLSMVAAAVLIALGVADRLRDQRKALSEAQRRAQIDPLTGVLNRRSLVERLDAACLRAQARGLPIALLFIDLDHFKEINDTYGHPAGDACLKAIIGPMQAELRSSDVIGRYGGEEFVVILSSADAAAARPLAERICKRVADVRVEGFGEPIKVTCSIGVATSDMLGVWGEHLIAQADAAVYTAKRSGRNQVRLAEPLAA